jgi:hypothetical protein
VTLNLSGGEVMSPSNVSTDVSTEKLQSLSLYYQDLLAEHEPIVANARAELQVIKDLLSARGQAMLPEEAEIRKQEHPWLKFAGMYKDSELFKSVLENIAENRRKLDEQAMAEDETEEATI